MNDLKWHMCIPVIVDLSNIFIEFVLYLYLPLMSFQWPSWNMLFGIFWKRKNELPEGRALYVITTGYLIWHF